MTFKALGFGGIAIVLCSIPALAHHSFSMFDGGKSLTLKGTVTEFRWTNPHGWIVMMVPSAQGKPEQWNIEMQAPLLLARQGWVPKTLVPSMNITVVAHPLRDGTPGGQFMEVTLPDGKTLRQPGRATAD